MDSKTVLYHHEGVQWTARQLREALAAIAPETLVKLGYGIDGPAARMTDSQPVVDAERAVLQEAADGRPEVREDAVTIYADYEAGDYDGVKHDPGPQWTAAQLLAVLADVADDAPVKAAFAIEDPGTEFEGQVVTGAEFIMWKNSSRTPDTYPDDQFSIFADYATGDYERTVYPGEFGYAEDEE